MGQKPVSTGPTCRSLHFPCHISQEVQRRLSDDGEARDQIGTAEEWTLLLAESEGNCPFQGHWGEAELASVSQMQN